MIYSISGKLVEKAATQVIVEAGGIGYKLDIPLSTYERLGEEGAQAALYTHMTIRDDCVFLYGFATVEERSFFELLINVPGVGPRVALRVLSGLSVPQLHEAIVQEDASPLCRIPGIGAKTG